MAYKLVRLNPVLALRGRSRSAHYVDIKDGLFTPPVQIGPRAVAWPQNEVCLLYTSPSPRDRQKSRMPSSA